MVDMPPPPPPAIQAMTPAEDEWSIDLARSAAIVAVEMTAGSTRIIGMTLRPSQRASGWVACGHVDTGDRDARRLERFVAFVPGSIAMTDGEDPDLIEDFWTAIGCDTPAE